MAEHIPLERVTSSNVRALGYHPDKQILAVQFNSGAIFHYASVPPEVAALFNVADSIGHVYTTRIKGRFPGQRMTGPCPRCKDEGWIGERCTDCGTDTYQERPRAHTPEASAGAHGAPEPVPTEEAPQDGEPHRRRVRRTRTAPAAPQRPERRPGAK